MRTGGRRGEGGETMEGGDEETQISSQRSQVRKPEEWQLRLRGRGEQERALQWFVG